MEPLDYPVAAPPAGIEQNQPRAERFDGQICAVETAVAEQTGGFAIGFGTVHREDGSESSRMGTQHT